ncbi:MAG: FAD-dependent oxidoreductase [Lachnospiraceae bacterium]|nr:FAD-dependent oxidoreductase [Lachnospiraceae bacterium]
MESIWNKTEKLPHFDELRGNIKTDVLIVGGGIAGILCAHFLKERGVNYILVEKDTICSHTTGNTTAKITAQHGLIYQKLIKMAGTERARQYLEANQLAVRKYFELCKGMDCDFVEKNNFVYSVRNREKIEAEMRALEKLGMKPLLTSAGELPVQTVGAVGFAHQAQFHPLKFIASIVKDLKLYEHTFVKGFVGNSAITRNGKISFQRLVVATHFPMDNKHGLYFMKLYQHRSYVLALAGAPIPQGMYVDESKTGFSFRGQGEVLLLSGGGHRTGQNGGAWQELTRFAKRNYKKAYEVTRFAAQDCMTLDGIPYIGKYSKNMGESYVVTGFNKWGMTSSMVGAMLLADMLTGRKNPYTNVFDPSRSMFHTQLLVNLSGTAANFLIPSKRRCPHLGCVLKWNSAEHSWDCPCHGSRFTRDGRLLDNPANGSCYIPSR